MADEVKVNVNAKNVNTEVNEQQVEEQVEQQVEEQVLTYKDKIRNCIADGWTKVSGLIVKNVTFEERDNYTAVMISLNKPIDGYISKDEGITYEKGKTNVIFTSTFAIAGMLKENPDLSYLANILNENPKGLSVILNGAEISILSKEIAAGEVYVNPFTTIEEKEGTSFDHDLIINHVIGCKLGKSGAKFAERAALAMLGL